MDAESSDHAKHNEANERLKRDYFVYLMEARRYDEQLVDAVAKAIARFEDYMKRRDFKAFRTEQAVAFKRQLAEQPNRRGTGKLGKPTVVSTLKALRYFFIWPAGQPGYRSRFTYSDADFFNPSERDMQIALGRRPRDTPSLEMIMAAIVGTASRAHVVEYCRDRMRAHAHLAQPSGYSFLHIMDEDVACSQIFQAQSVGDVTLGRGVAAAQLGHETIR